MNRLPLLFRWLTVAALADWLITRTLTRTAIFMPKPPPIIALYQALTLFGQLAFTLVGLLSLTTAIWITWRLWQKQRLPGLPLVLLILIALSLVGLFVVLTGWMVVLQVTLRMIMVLIIGWDVRLDPRGRVGWIVPALAIWFGELHQWLPAWYTALHWPGPPPLTEQLFNLGELFVVLTPGALWWAAGYSWRAILARRNWWTVLPALAFIAAHTINPAMTGIIAIWSTGLTLYLPWPLYALSLWLAGVLVSESAWQNHAVGWALLLLAAGGYTPQLSTQVLISLIALWLIANPQASRDAKVYGLHPPLVNQTANSLQPGEAR